MGGEDDVRCTWFVPLPFWAWLTEAADLIRCWLMEIWCVNIT